MKQFEQMSKMMKMMQGPGGNLMKTMGGMKEWRRRDAIF
jgi:signal recognition particle subunit SRP54